MSQMTEDSQEGDIEGTEICPHDEGHLQLEDVHGFSLTPTIQPLLPYAVVYAVGPLIVVWDWKVKFNYKLLLLI